MLFLWNMHNKIDHFYHFLSLNTKFSDIKHIHIAVHICVVLSCFVLFNSAILWTVAHQAPLSMGFSKQEYWTGLPFPSSGDLPHPGTESTSPTSARQEDSLPLGHLGSPYCCTTIKTCFVSNYMIWWEIFMYSRIL